MAEILLNDLHVHVQRYEERSAGVAQVVEADIPHPVLLQQLRKVGGDIVGLISSPKGLTQTISRYFLL